MRAGSLTVIDGEQAGAWIAPRLQGEFGAVTLQVPSGYAAYVRVCHPATDPCGEPVTWADVAAATGRVAHPLMQWHVLVGSRDYLNFKGSLWPGGDPDRGDLAPEPLERLCRVLRRHTTDADRCFFGVWEGWSGVHDGGLAFSGEELTRRRLLLPHREYVVLAGPLSAVGEIGDPAGVNGFEPCSPNLIWPADRAWFVASEIDFDSTLIGGTADLIKEILDTPELDAWPVSPEDSLAYDADLINPFPDWR
jgi:hypothetical protein